LFLFANSLIAKYNSILLSKTKAKRAAALVWGQKPEIKVFDYPTRDQTRISLVSAYAIKVVQDDAIVNIDVAVV
jgi:hypothetical protein